MSRYKLASVWHTLRTHDDRWRIQHADAVDTRTGTIFQSGAYRVLDGDKAVSKVFYGEVAWADADRLFYDLKFKEMYK